MPALPSVVVYRNPACPDFRALKTWLSGLRVPFEERHLDEAEGPADDLVTAGVCVAPVTVIDGQVFRGNFRSQKPRMVEALAPAAIG